MFVGELVQALGIVVGVLAAMVLVLVMPEALDHWLSAREDRRRRSLG
jgi:hypothetical protein